ncbi:MMPL family transporter [Paenibacillus sp. KN14-4R]|uniref:MMPL family transporter n=1 Tax=Paenibacillus sp. KN14-4R TaxID=3445773 RepID=UPI003F9FA8ED
MIDAWLRNLAKFKWLIVAVWIMIAAASVLVFPDLKQIVRATEWKFVPKDAESVQAHQILEQMVPDHKSKSNAVVVLNREGGLTDSDRTWLQNKVSTLTNNQASLGIAGVLSASADPAIAEKFLSKDKSTEMIIVEFPKEVQVASTGDSVKLVKEAFTDTPQGATVEFTGSAPIFLDYNHSTEAGLARSELLTVILVIVILLIVFRSPIAPLVPLVTIGISVILSRGLIAAFTYWGLPVSSFTETFLIAVLFGAGTDYCILLIHRFREELTHTTDRVEALINTIKTVGKTVMFAGSTVFIAFFLIGFAKFGLYQSAAGVAIGMAVTLLAAVTLTPAIMLIFGPKLFWPIRVKPGQEKHHDSKLWGVMGNLAVKRSGVVLLVCLIVLSPFIMLYQGSRSFDDLDEMDQSASAVKGFRKVEEKFSSGEVLPVTIAISSHTSMRSPEALAALERASADASKLTNVREVRSAARPLGKQIIELTVPNQLSKTNQALTEIGTGVNHIGDGLHKAQTEIDSKTGDLDKLLQGANQIADNLKTTQGGLSQIAGGITQSNEGAQQLSGAAVQLEQTSQSMNADLNNLVKSFPELVNDPSYQALVAKNQGVTGGLSQTSNGLKSLTQGLSQLTGPTKKIADGLGQLAAGQTQVATGVGELKNGLGQFSSGLGEGTTGLTKISDGIKQVVNAQQGIADNSTNQIVGWYMPKDLLEESNDLSKALDMYMSKDGKIAKLDVVLSINPYSKEAMDTIDVLHDTVTQSLKGSAIQNAEIKIAGTTAQYHELKGISGSDFLKTGALMIAGIYIVLALQLRSLLMPLYLLASLLFNYFVTMGILEFIFVHLLGYQGLSWTVSFFLFVIIVALGVDYNIFLMARFKEQYRPGEVIPALLKAMKSTGGVIMSAAVIMSGTFAALMPAGVTTLLQLGAGIVIGLIIYTTIVMGLMIPSLTAIFGEANWWPFRKKSSTEDTSVAPVEIEG